MLYYETALYEVSFFYVINDADNILTIARQNIEIHMKKWVGALFHACPFVILNIAIHNARVGTKVLTLVFIEVINCVICICLVAQKKKEFSMSALRILLLICAAVFVGNIVLMILDSTSLNIWIARILSGIACAITGISLTNYYQKKRTKK